MTGRATKCWAILERSNNALDGDRSWLRGVPDGTARTLLFPTRQEARDFIANKFGYIAKRPNLRTEPHGWTMPRAVRVVVEVRVLGGGGA